MITGTVVAAGSLALYCYGKIFVEPRVYDIIDAPRLEFCNIVSGYGYIDGEAVSSQPIIVNGNEYIRTVEENYHVTSGRLVSYDSSKLSDSNLEKRKDNITRLEFIQKTLKHNIDVKIGGINVWAFVKTVPLKFVGDQYQSINDLVHGVKTVNNINCPLDKDYKHLLGEHERQVIGVETKQYGLKNRKHFTVFGYYDAKKNKLKLSAKYPNIISTLSRDEIIKSETSFANKIKYFSSIGMLVGVSVLGVTTYFFNK